MKNIISGIFIGGVAVYSMPFFRVVPEILFAVAFIATFKGCVDFWGNK